MPGPPPKDPKMRQRTNRDTTAMSFVDRKPISKAPPLPKRRRKWRTETIAWWEDIWKSPMAPEYITVDIHGLVLLADLIDRYWRKPTPALATEIRLQRQCFGLTPIDRRRLQWSVEKAEDAATRGQKRREKGRRLKAYKIDPRAILEQTN